MTIILDGTNGITFPDNSVKYGNIPQVTVYTSGSGTYTVPTGCKYLTIRMVGGGAGGGSSNGANAGGGGGAGGYLEALITNPSATYSYAVGSGGTASGNGGATTFSTLTCNGGSTGTINSTAATGGAGGTATGGYLNQTGASGCYSWAASPYYNGGAGGGTPFGAGGSGAGTNNGGGFASVSYGAGGGGGVGGGSGGAGTGGVIIITANF